MFWGGDADKNVNIVMGSGDIYYSKGAEAWGQATHGQVGRRGMEAKMLIYMKLVGPSRFTKRLAKSFDLEHGKLGDHNPNAELEAV